MKSRQRPIERAVGPVEIAALDAGLGRFDEGAKQVSVDAGHDRRAYTTPRRLWISGPMPGLNELIEAAKGARGTGRRYATLKAAWTDKVTWCAKAARLPRMRRAQFAFLWLEENRRRNCDNIAAGGRKMIFDGLVKAGVLANDGWSEIAGWTDTFEVGEFAGVEVTMEEVT